jgi:hypothetical protein
VLRLGDQDLERGARGNQLPDQRGRLEYLLEVVQEQQQLLAAKVVFEVLFQWSFTGLRDPKGPRDGGSHEGGVNYWCQGDEERAVLEFV